MTECGVLNSKNILFFRADTAVDEGSTCPRGQRGQNVLALYVKIKNKAQLMVPPKPRHCRSSPRPKRAPFISHDAELVCKGSFTSTIRLVIAWVSWFCPQNSASIRAIGLQLAHFQPDHSSTSSKYRLEILRIVLGIGYRRALRSLIWVNTLRGVLESVSEKLACLLFSFFKQVDLAETTKT